MLRSVATAAGLAAAITQAERRRPGAGKHDLDEFGHASEPRLRQFGGSGAQRATVSLSISAPSPAYRPPPARSVPLPLWGG